MWETGSYKQRNIEIGSMVTMVRDPIIQPCFAMEARGSARPTLGKGAHSPQSRFVAEKP